MKKLIIISLLLLSGIFLKAQVKDSTQIVIGKNKITVYNEEARELEALKKSQKDFSEKMRWLTDSISKLKIEISKPSEKALKEQIEFNIAEFEKQIEAYQKGITDLQKEIEKIGELIELEEMQELEELEENEELEELEEFEEIDEPRKKRKFKGHWAGFEFGLNNFTNSNYEIALSDDGKFMELNTNKSWEFALNFMEFNIPLFSRYFGLVTGMGVEWDGYEFKQNIKIQEDETTGVIVGMPVTDYDYKKNKLNVTYLKVPLLFEAQIPVNHKDHRIFINAGATLSVKARAKLKQIYDVNGNEQKDRAINDFQLNPLNYGLTARIGYRNIRLFANYSLSPLFEKNQGPELYPFSVGISLINF